MMRFRGVRCAVFNHAAVLAAFCLTLAAAPMLAQPAAAQKRVALVVGNGGYTHAAALSNPANDAADMSDALKELGIEVILGLDLDKRAFDGKVRDFAARPGRRRYGHFLLCRTWPAGVRAATIWCRLTRSCAASAISTSRPWRSTSSCKQMELDRESKTNIVFLDACRDNPLARNLARSMGTRSASIGRGLAQVQTGVGTFIAYSTQPGNVALDGTGRNSPFTAALAKNMKAPGRNLTAVMIDVRKEVLAVTNGKQVPWDHSALTGDFFFHLASAPASLPKVAPAPPGSDSAALQERLQQLEEELKRKSDPQQTARLVELAQLKERVRQIDDANRADQQRIFEVHRKYGPSSDPVRADERQPRGRRHPDADGSARPGAADLARSDR